MRLSTNPVMFIRVAIFKVTSFGIWVVAQDCTAWRSAGASSPPEEVNVQLVCAATAPREANPRVTLVRDDNNISSLLPRADYMQPL